MRYEDTSKMALSGEFLATLIDEYLDLLIEKNKLKEPSEDEKNKIREKVLKIMRKRYPSVGIVLEKKEK